MLSRRAVASGSLAALVLPSQSAHAASKYDKAFDDCLSKCVYEKTKITKGVGQVEVVSRADAFAECKPKCATSKDQLLTGQPKGK